MARCGWRCSLAVATAAADTAAAAVDCASHERGGGADERAERLVVWAALGLKLIVGSGGGGVLGL